jgi:hypothetical protein
MVRTPCLAETQIPFFIRDAMRFRIKGNLRNKMMSIVTRSRFASTLLLAGGLATAPLAAQAQWHGGGGGCCYHGGGGNFVGGALLGLGVGAVLGGALAPHYYAPPPPVYYAPPPPVYYAPPPPVYYAPPPVYYAAPPPGYPGY